MKSETSEIGSSSVSYDLLGKITEETRLTRKSATAILSAIEPSIFGQFKSNPEHFIAECIKIITGQIANITIEKISYTITDDRYEVDIFTAGEYRQDLSDALGPLEKHVYDYAVTDSKTEKKLLADLEASSEVIVYAKLPSGFLIPTPVGGYNPDWAIVFTNGDIKHIYFIAETKGSLDSLDLRQKEESKVECAKKFFKQLSDAIDEDKLQYGVIKDYASLIDLIGNGSPNQAQS